VADLSSGSIANLVSFTPSGTLDASLPLSANLGGTLGNLGTITVAVHDADLFSGAAPDVSLSFQLSADLQTQILNVLQKLKDAASKLAGSVLDTKLPVLDKSVNDLLAGGPGKLLGLYDQVKAYFDSFSGTANLPTVDGLIQLLSQQLGNGAHGQLSEGPLSLSGGLFTDKKELSFHLVVDAHSASNVPIDLGSQAQNLGLSVNASAQLGVDAELKADLSFGLDLTNLLAGSGFSASDGFFEVDDLEGQAHVHATGLNFGVTFGSLSAGIQNGTFDLNADAAVIVQKSDGTKRLTLADLQTTPITDLVNFTPSGSLDATLPLSASLAGFGALNGLVVKVHDADLFSGAAPDVSLSFALGQSLQAQILSILQKFQNVIQGVAGSVLDTKLPVLGKSLDDLIGGGQTTVSGLFSLYDLVNNYFNPSNPPPNPPLPTVDGLIQLLEQNLLGRLGSGAQGQFSEGPLSLSGGLIPAQNELLFHVVLDAHRAANLPIDLGAQGKNLGLSLDASAQLAVDAELKADLSFGIDLTSFLANPSGGIGAGAVFVKVDDLEAHANVQASNLNFGATLGFLHLGVAGGSAAVSGSANVTVSDPGTDPGTEPDGKISLAELQGVSSLASLVSFTPAGTLQVVLPVSASIGDFSTPTDPASQPTITISDSDLFHNAPDFQTNNFGNLLDFGSLGPQQVLQALVGVGTWLQGFGNLPLMKTAIPFVHGQTVGSVINAGTAFTKGLLNQLETSGGDPTFGSAQALADKLASVLNLPASAIAAHYDPSTNELTYHVNLDYTFAPQPLPLNVNLNLDDLAGLSTSATLNLTANADVQFTFGFQMVNPLDPSQSVAPFIDNASVTGAASLGVDNFQATARFAVVAVHVNSGSAGVNASLTLNPTNSQGGSRILLSDLSGLAVNPTLTGSAHLDLQDISIDAGVLSTPPTAHPSMHVLLPDFIHDPSNIQITTQDIDQLLALQGLDLGKIVAQLQSALHTLSTYSSFSFLDSKLPVINKSIMDLIDYASPLVRDVASLTGNGSLQDLNTQLSTLLGLPAGSNALQFNYDSAGKAFKMDLTLDDSVFSWLGFKSKPLAFDLDLASLTALLGNSPSDLSIKAFLKDLSSIVDVSGQATVNVSASASVTLDVGFDLDSTSAHYLEPFLYDDTGATLDAQFSATGINFTASVLGMGLYVENGTAYLNADGQATTTNPAEFAVGLGDKGQRIYFGDDLLSHFTVGLTGGVSIDLPTYFPINTLSVGALGVSIPSLAALFNHQPGQPDPVTFTTPDFSHLLDSFSSLLGVFTTPGALTGGIDALLTNVQNGLDDLGHNLPLVGTGLTSAATFVHAFQANLETKLNSVLGGLSPMQALQQALFNFFGPSGLNLLAAPNSDALAKAGDPIGQDVQFNMTKDASNNVQNVQLNMHLHGEVSTTVSLATDVGLPGLGLKVSDNVQLPVTLSWDLYLGFGYDASATNDKFYIDVSPAHLLSVNVDVLPFDPHSQPHGASFTAGLGFLQLTATDTTTASTEGFHGSFTVDLKDPASNPRQRLTFDALTTRFDPSQDIIVALAANADLNLHLTVSYQGNPEFPQIDTDFHLGWRFSPTDPNLDGETPTVAFNDVKLDLGTFFSNFVEPILQKVDQRLGAVRVVGDFLDAPIPVLSNFSSQPVSLLDVAAGLLHEPVDGLKAFIHFLDTVHSLAYAAPGGTGVSLDLGGSTWAVRTYAHRSICRKSPRTLLPPRRRSAVSATPAARTLCRSWRTRAGSASRS
jgi:hypothetical protein